MIANDIDNTTTHELRQIVVVKMMFYWQLAYIFLNRTEAFYKAEKPIDHIII